MERTLKEGSVMDFYTTERINESITLIRSCMGELLYLIEGKKRAALVDTCVGAGHLRSLVESLTDKPYFVLLTHGHVDHAPGAAEFNEVWLNEKDLPLYRRQCTLEERMGYMQACMGPHFSELDRTSVLEPVPDKKFMPLNDGDNFDLGGLHIDAFAMPGHTPGCMVFLIRELRTLILGDACNNSTFLFDDDAGYLDEYAGMLRNLRDRLAGTYDHVYLSHHDMETGTDIMNNVLEVCREAAEGKADDIPYDFMGHHAFIAKKCDERFRREDGKCGNIIYSKEKLHR